MAEFANVYVIHPRDPGSNLGVDHFGIDKIFSDSVCIDFEFKFVER